MTQGKIIDICPKTLFPLCEMNLAFKLKVFPEVRKYRFDTNFKSYYLHLNLQQLILLPVLMLDFFACLLHHEKKKLHSINSTTCDVNVIGVRVCWHVDVPPRLLTCCSPAPAAGMKRSL